MSFNNVDIVCFSHLRWSFVFQRPQHLMSRFAESRRVFYIEEAVEANEHSAPSLKSSTCPETGVRVITPALPKLFSKEEIIEGQRRLLQTFLRDNGIHEFVAWYYTPMAMQFSSFLKPRLTLYDCMDELSAFAGAPPEMQLNERLLFAAADLVFTGGASLFASKRKQHSSVHLFPSSVDVSHFAKARLAQVEPADQRPIPHPRLGYAGVIDERMDLELVKQAAIARPNWHFVFLGPVVKIDPSSLPQGPNIHYLGMKQYSELPSYFSGWDLALLPFALNESTRYISPTKTPEYLAAGLPVVSTPIRDVVSPYGDLGFAQIAADPPEFVSAAELLLSTHQSGDARNRVDEFLARSSWNKTQKEMDELMRSKLRAKEEQSTNPMVLSNLQAASTAGSVSNV